MPHYDYLIIGGGMAADAAVRGIREVDSTGSVGLISLESDPPYDRPPLTKGLWKGDPLDSIWRHTTDKGAELLLGQKVEAIDVRNKRVRDAQNQIYSYKKLLIATGGRPRLLPFGNGRIIYYRTIADYRRLRELANTAQRFAVIGGGFIGSEVAAALASQGKEVTIIFPGTTIGGRLFPHDLGEFLNDYYRRKGITVLPHETVIGLDEMDGKVVLHTRGGLDIETEGVVAGIGIDPNTELAQYAGLHVENGIIVDELLNTSHPDVFAAGDVAAFFSPTQGRVIRVEHEDNANTMGRTAGRNMAGANELYHHQPFFYSDLFDLGYEAVGDLDARLEAVPYWRDPYVEGVVYYLHEGSVRGVLLWNVRNQVENARRLIAEGGPFRPGDVRGKMPEELLNVTHFWSR